jgi:hypothetical protein
MAHVEFQKNNKVTLGFPAAAVATGTTTGSFWGMDNAHHAAVVFIVGTVTAATTISVVQGNATGTTGGTTATISGKSTALGTADSNSTKIIEVEASELNVASAYKSIAAKAVAAGGGAIVGATVIRVPLRNYPPSVIT